MMTPCVVTLDSAASLDPRIAGEKGALLARLRALQRAIPVPGWRTPAGRVLTTAAFGASVFAAVQGVLSPDQDLLVRARRMRDITRSHCS